MAAVQFGMAAAMPSTAATELVTLFFSLGVFKTTP